MPRIKSINSLERPSNIREVNKKYFFVLEGTSTEVLYLSSIISTKKTNAHIFYFYRNASNPGSSNLKVIADSILEVLEGKARLSLMYINFTDIIVDLYATHNILIDGKRLKSKIESYVSSIGKNLHDEIDIEEIPGVISKIQNCFSIESFELINQEETLARIINEQSTFDKAIDEIILIGDRDKKSFTEEQFDEVASMSKEKGINLIITNPCIEFWFLLHHTDAISIDKSEWTTSDNAAKLVYDQLKVFDPKYTKTRFNVREYVNKTEIAIENCKNYCSELDQLKSSIGSNFPKMFKLIDQM